MHGAKVKILMVFEERVVTKIFGPKEENIRGVEEMAKQVVS